MQTPPDIFQVRQITAEETYPVRLSELRKGMTLSDCQLEGDHERTTAHLGGFHNDTLVAVASLLKSDNERHQLSPAHQLRGMAVLEAHWKKGYGQQLVVYGEKLVRATESDYLWMNAREVAFGFYEKLGFTKIGPIFDVPRIGAHQVLFKRINHKPLNEKR